MNAEQLSRVGEKLVKRCGSRDPFEIARQLGINVMLCENFGSLKGMYRVIKRNRFIFLNNSLDENMLRIVCAHELGHDQLHRNMAKTTPIHEFMRNRQISRRIKKHLWLSNRSWARDVHSFGILHSWGALAGKSCSAQASSIWLIAGAFRRTQSK